MTTVSGSVTAAQRLPPAIAILGPTGCGKSALALRVAAAAPVEIISVDSAQVYRGLDVGTAKPSAAEQAAVPHHLIDIRDPEESYSAGMFRDDALRLIKEITARGRMPVLVGGTMLYFRALFRGLADLPRADVALRTQIDDRAAREGWPALHAQLAARDPEAAAQIHPNDAHRIQRALEIALISGASRTALWQQHVAPAGFDRWHIAVLEPTDRAGLHEALARRLADMLAAGFPAEVKRLLSRDTLSDKSHIFRLVGYRQLLPHARGEETLQIAEQKILAATRQFAKRQITWLRGDNLLPSGATLMRVNPFDAASTRFLRESLINAARTP